MLERRREKPLPAREQIIVDESLEPTEAKEITHIRLYDGSFGFPAGVYQWNSGNQCLTTLDDDMIGRLDINKIVKKVFEKAAVIVKTMRHVPTWNRMIENGEVVDNRTKTEEEVEKEQKIKDKINPPVRRKLLM